MAESWEKDSMTHKGGQVYRIPSKRTAQGSILFQIILYLKSQLSGNWGLGKLVCTDHRHLTANKDESSDKDYESFGAWQRVKNENERSYYKMSEAETKVVTTATEATKVETAETEAAKAETTATVENKKKGMSARDLTTLGLLTGILLVMSFTPLGYFRTLGLSISLMMIPVGIGAMLLGPKAGLWLGFIFGATSFYQALTGSSPFSAMLMNISPLGTFLTCIPTRMLMGFLTGVIFLAAQKLDRKKTACFFVGGFFAAFLNTLFFMGVLLLCFWNTEYIQEINATLGGLNPVLFVGAFVGVNGIFEMTSSCIVGGVVSKAVSRTLYKKVV